MEGHKREREQISFNIMSKLFKNACGCIQACECECLGLSRVSWSQNQKHFGWTDRQEERTKIQRTRMKDVENGQRRGVCVWGGGWLSWEEIKVMWDFHLIASRRWILIALLD